MYHFDFTEDPFGRAYMENKKRSIGERIALGTLEAAKYLDIRFPENCMLPTVNWFPPNGGCGFSFSIGIWYVEEKYDALIAAHPEHADGLRLLKTCMGENYTHERVGKGCQTQNDLRLQKAMACWGGEWGGHANLDYDRLLHLGTDGIRDLIEASRLENPGKDEFYSA